MLSGILALAWFLIRVIPKPSRASYPCQRAAFPIASSFVIWLTGTIISIFSFNKAKYYKSRLRYVSALLCLIVFAISAVFTYNINNPKAVYSYAPLAVNDPIGTARGINPGRVVWAYDPDVIDWAGPGSGQYWWDHIDQDVADAMMSKSLKTLSGQPNESSAWNNIFVNFNESKGNGTVGYQAGEKIMIKLNLVAFHRGANVDSSGNITGGYDRPSNSPQMVLALLDQLVNVVGVDPTDITIGDTICDFPNIYYTPIQAQFPGVVCLTFDPTTGRVLPTRSTSAFIHWSSGDELSEGVPTCFENADYVINFAVLKGHRSAGITACAKNHFGSFLRTPGDFSDWWGDDVYLDMHPILPQYVSGMGHYRPFVDLMGSNQYDGKCVLFLIDAIMASNTEVANAVKMQMPPFNDDWPSSLFMSQDPVAIDSVAYDFLYEEFDGTGDNGTPHMSGAEDYLHEAAEAGDPLSGTIYDPDNNGDGLSSLGAHEHWNNAIDKQYTRNIGSGDGIELVIAKDFTSVDTWNKY